jgi:serine protease Do
MATQVPGPERKRGPGYTTAVVLALVAVIVGALLGGIVLPQYAGIRPIFSLQPPPEAPNRPAAPQAPAPPQAPAAHPSPAPGVPTPSAPPAAQVPPPSPVPPSVRGALGLTREEAVVVNVVKIVRPSVVNINTESQVQTMFGVFPQQGAGSGVIVRRDGYILTNNHVVQGATTIKVTLLGGKVLTGRVVGTDPFVDLAVVKVDTPEALPAATLGTSGNLQVGQLAIAIGNPFGLGSTVTTGVVSALNRNIQLPSLIVENLIQTSAAINPGNSGGALVNSSGEVVGINTAIIPNAQDIGFAIPSDVARVEMDQLISQGRVVRPWVGVDYGGDVDPQTARAYNLGADHGVLVRQAEPGSPAVRAGIQPGDIITAVNGGRIENWNDFVRGIVDKKVGETVTLTVVRDRATRNVPVTLAERPAEPR